MSASHKQRHTQISEDKSRLWYSYFINIDMGTYINGKIIGRLCKKQQMRENEMQPPEWQITHKS